MRTQRGYIYIYTCDTQETKVSCKLKKNTYKETQEVTRLHAMRIYILLYI